MQVTNIIIAGTAMPITTVASSIAGMEIAITMVASSIAGMAMVTTTAVTVAGMVVVTAEAMVAVMAEAMVAEIIKDIDHAIHELEAAQNEH